MKKFTFLRFKDFFILSFIFFTSFVTYGQCINTNAYLTANANTNTSTFPESPGTNITGQPQQIGTCTFYTEYNTINNLIVDSPYIFTASSNGTDVYVTITDASNVVIAHGPSPLLISSITAATVRLHPSADALCTVTPNTCLVTSVQFLPACPSPNQLSISNLTTTSVDLSWNPLGSEAAWDVQWGEAGFTLGDGTIVTNLTSASYELLNLTSSTAYQFYVRAKCATEDSNWNGPFNFITLCVGVEEFIQNFDTSPTGFSNTVAMPICWARGGTGTVYNTTGSVSPMSAPNRMYMFASGTGTPTEAYVMTPALSNLQAGTHRLKFKAFSFDSDRIMEVGYMTDATDVSTFVFIQEISLPNTPETAVEFTVLPGVLPANAVRLAFKNPGFPAASTGLYLDDVKWEVASSCADPTALLANNVTDSSFTAAWTAGANETEWEVQYGLSNFALGSGTIIEDIATPSVVVPSLSSNTTYQYYVRAVCTDEPSSWVGPITVTTNCSASAVPVFETFDTFLPGCWEKKTGVLEANSVLVGNNVGNWFGGNFANGGSNPAVRINLYGTQNSWLISEPIDLGATPSLHRVRYNVALTNFFGTNALTDMGTHTVHVVVSPDGGNTWSNTNIIKTYEGTGFVPGEEFVNLTGFSGIVKIGFVATTNSFSPDIDFHLDNFRVEIIPGCEEPTNISVSDVTKFGATINYTHALPDVTTADVQYGAIGFTLGDGTIVNGTTNPIILSGLMSSTDYHFYVRNVCAVGSESPWVGPFQFTTICDYPELSGTVPGEVCGEGTVLLSAQSSTPTADFEWYAMANGGVPIGNEANFTTPFITETTSYYVSSTSIIPNTNVVLGNGALNSTFQSGTTFNHGWGGYKTQNLILAEDLLAAGVSSGPINSVAWELLTTGTANRNNFSLAIKATTITAMTNTHQDGMIEVFSTPVLNLTTGQNTILFSTPFVWDGTSNIIIQTCWSNENFGGSGATVLYDNTSYVSSTYTYADNQTAATLCATMTGAAGGSGFTDTSSVRPKFTFNATGVCRSPRQEVVATVTMPDPIVVEAADNSVCAGNSTTLSVTSTNTNYVYTWNPGNLVGASVAVSPTEDTVYSVTAVDATADCQLTATVSVGVILVPTQTVTIEEVSVCENDNSPITLEASASTGEIFNYNLNLIDSFGDGWNGNTMSLLVNGVIVLDGVTMASGSNISYPFQVVGADAITTQWIGGGAWIGECSYTITDHLGNEIFAASASADGPAPVTTPLVVPSSISISWWTEATGGTQIASGDSINLVGTSILPNTSVPGEYMVYVQSENDGCASLVRTPITVNVIAAPMAPAAEAQTFCDEADVDDLVAMGTELNWYDSATATEPLSSSTDLMSGTYYVSQTNESGCESARTAVEVTITILDLESMEDVFACDSYVLPTLTLGNYFTGENGTGTALMAGDVITTSQTIYVYVQEGICSDEKDFEVVITTVSVDEMIDVVSCEPIILPNLLVGNYYTETNGGGTMLNAGDVISTSQTVYVYAVIGDCSDEVAFSITINTTDAPTGDATQEIEEGSTVAAIVVVGENIMWYATEEDALAGTNALNLTDVLVSAVYYATQTANGCTSAPFAVEVNLFLSADGFDMTELKYYPNPVNNTLNISYSEMISSVKVINVLGQTVMSANQNSNFVTIDMSQLPAGSYMVQIESNDTTAIVKIMKR